MAILHHFTQLIVVILFNLLWLIMFGRKDFTWLYNPRKWHSLLYYGYAMWGILSIFIKY